MRSLFIFRDSYDAKFVLSKLEEANLPDAIILEKGTNAKITKIKRSIKKTFFLYYPRLILDLFSLSIFLIIVEAMIEKRMGRCTYPKNKIRLIIDNVNDDACIGFIKKNKPKVIFIYGTSILREKFLSEINPLILNIHSGILPDYRNVHSDYWAYANNDYNKIGISIIYVDKGIDSGDIALQKTIDYKKGDSLIDIKIKNLKLIPILIEQIIKEIEGHKLKRRKQNFGNVGYYNSPRFIDFVRLAIKSI